MINSNKDEYNNITFVGFPRCNKFSANLPEVAIIGIPFTTSNREAYYGTNSGTIKQMVVSGVDSSSSPSVIRKQSLRYLGDLNNYDFDFGGDIFAGRNIKIADWGDIEMTPENCKMNQQKATEEVRWLLEHNIFPIVLGGDHATTTQVLKAYKDHGPITIVQIDAHLDWRDEVNGDKEGLSSPMRRASEMPWVNSMVQIGLRGFGSARKEEVLAAREYQSIIVPAMELHKIGVDEVISKLPKACQYYITLDADGLDPSIAPGVFGPPAPGGLTYYQVLGLMQGIARKGTIVGFDLVEVCPTVDINDTTSLLGARIILNLIGILSYQGQIGS
jgi:agmatinase